MKTNSSARWQALLILPILLAACQAPTPAPTVTPAATATPVPTDTPSPIPPSPTVTDTPTPIPPTATSTATPNHNATATRESVLATATNLAQLPLVLDDPFDAVAHGWVTGQQTNDGFAKVNLKISGGKYHWEIVDQKPVSWIIYANTSIPSDFTYSVDIQELKSAPGSNFGLILRSSTNNSSYYFAFRNDGNYAVLLFNKGQGSFLRNYSFTKLIKADQVNHFAVAATGSQFRIFVNDEYLATIVDDTLVKGRIGLAVGLDHAKDESIVEFDNVQVRAEKATSQGTGSGGVAATQAPAAATQAPTDSGPALGKLIIFECVEIENTVTIFKDGQIVKQDSLHSLEANVYLLPPGHYDVQYNAVGYYNLNFAYDIQANGEFTQYLDGRC
jgi:hypothetical protein